ncbi:MAG: LPS-assembly protein LptD, partial [Desulfomonilaceae bacterium]
MISRQRTTFYYVRAIVISIVFTVLGGHYGLAVALEQGTIETTVPTSILPGDLPVKMSAERLSYNYKTNTYTAHGNVSLTQGSTKLRADSIVYEGKTGELTATGGVIVRSGADVIEAEKVTINLKASTGVLFNGKLLLTRQHIYLQGKELEKKGSAEYSVKEGSFTTCDGATPDWKITGKDLDVTLEGYGTLKHGFFYIRDIPVFYLPWLIYPAKRERQTGFLMPSVASSTLRGIDIRAPFFLNISPSVDATISPRFCSKRAFQGGLEFRYNPTEDLKGRFYGEYTYDWKYGPPPDPIRNLFYGTWRHDQSFSGAARLKTNLQWVSDRNYFDIW